MSETTVEKVTNSVQKINLASNELVNNENVVQDSENAVDQSDTFWGFSIFEAYKMALKFYRENDGKRTFTLTYDDKVYLAALTKQVSCGPYNDQNNLPEVGYLDLFGRDRRKVWCSFNDMSSNEARRQFIDKLSKSAPVYVPYMHAHQKEEEEKQRVIELKIKQEEEQKEKDRIQRENENQLRLEKEKVRLQKEKLHQEQNKQKKALMAALNTQTDAQFQQYASQIHPGNAVKQKELIALLQEQHYQQYIQLLQQQQQKELNTSSLQQQQNCSDQLSRSIKQEESGDEAQNEQNDDASQSDSVSDSDSSEVQVAEPSLWTRPQLEEFKQQIKRDVESVINIGRGEVVTIRVPTHEQGSYIFWEFASDNYDIGFGVYFEWNSNIEDNNVIEVTHGESDDEFDESDEEIDLNDPERSIGISRRNTNPVDELVPIYRKNSHIEVNCGSHKYPQGRGVYLLKFDNSYSLWRSKTLYYRVYNTR